MKNFSFVYRDLCVVDAEWLYDAAPEYFKRRKDNR